MAGSRRKAREIALQILYQLDANPELGADDALGLYFAELVGSMAEEGIGPGDSSPGLPSLGAAGYDAALVDTLVRGVSKDRQAIDALLGKISRTWRLERMARLDRNILRMAVFELRSLRDVPVEVIINEAVDLAKRFGSAEAGAFINGVLDSAVSAGARPR